MKDPWIHILDFCVLGGGLALATLLRAKLALLQKFLVPNNIIAGFLCYIIGADLLGLYRFDSARFGNYVYHLLAIIFISLGLRKTEARKNLSAINTGFIVAISIGTQVFLGLVVAFLAMLWFLPDLFPNFGYLLMLGFSQGPGQAYALGKSWEPLGLADGGNLGLTFAAIGYIWACVVGIALVYRGLKKRKIEYQDQIDALATSERTGLYSEEERPEAGRLTTASSAIDSFTFHVVMVGLVYLATYGVLKGFDALITSGTPGKMLLNLRNTMWGIHYIFASLMALLFRKVLNRLGQGALLDNGLLTRVSGISLDFMVTAAIATLSFGIFAKYLGLILAMVTVGGLATLFLIVLMVRHSGMSHPLERMASIYGTMTGTLSTGLTLTRIVDPHFKSPAPQALVLGTAFTLPLAIPYIMSSFIPIYGMDRPSPELYILCTIGLAFGYTFILYLGWRFYLSRVKKRELG